MQQPGMELWPLMDDGWRQHINILYINKWCVKNKMAKCKHLSEFDKDQFVMDCWLGQSIC